MEGNRYYPNIFLEVVNKTTKCFGHDSRQLSTQLLCYSTDKRRIFAAVVAQWSVGAKQACLPDCDSGPKMGYICEGASLIHRKQLEIYRKIGM